MTQTIQIQVDTKIQWEVAKTNSGRWVAVCRPLGLTMEGSSLDELHDSVNDSVQLLLVDLFESGELDAFLRSKGWQKKGPQLSNHGEVKFDVPIDLLIHSARDSSRTLLQ